MIFKKLVENLPKIPKNATTKFNQGDTKVRKEIISRVLAAYNNPELLNNKYIFNTTYDSVMHYGLDTSINPWLQFLDQQNLDFDEPLSKQLPTLWQLHLKENLDLLQEFVLNDLNKIDFNKTTSVEEFNYTVKLLDVLNNRDKLSKFFNNPDVVDMAQLHQNNDVTKYYKRAGIGKHNDPDTLFGMVEIWSDGNEVSKENKDLTVTELRAIKKQYLHSTRDDIEKSLGGVNEIEDNTVIFAKSISHNSKPTSIDEMSDPHFWIWEAESKQWKEYNTPNSKRVLKEDV